MKFNFKIDNYDNLERRKDFGVDYITLHLDELTDDFKRASGDYNAELVKRLNELSDSFDRKIKFIELWFDGYNQSVKGKSNAFSFVPNTNSLLAVARKIEKEIGGKVTNDGTIRLYGSNDLSLHADSAYKDSSKENFIRLINVSRMKRILDAIMDEQFKHFSTHDNYYIKSREMHDFMWKWNIDFNNDIFNHKKVDDDTLESCWEFYQEIKNDLDNVLRKIKKFTSD